MTTNTADTSQPAQLDAGFSPVDYAQWRALAEQALKGGDFDRKLVSKSLDGILIQPVYQRAGDATVRTRSETGRPWRLAQRVDHPGAAAANVQALSDLEGGADMLSLVFAGATTAHGFGLSAETLNDLDAALKGVALDAIAVRLEPALAGRINAAMLASLVEKRGHTPGELSISFGFDPIGVLAASGTLAADWATVGERVAKDTAVLKQSGFAGPFIECDMRPYHAAGASEAQELAIALASGLAYLRTLQANGIDVSEAERALGWTFAVDADQFMGLAKLRAMRRLWARVQEASSLPLAPIRIHAETAWRMMTRRDAAVNMLRATIATFTAGVGGADSVTVLPFTAALGLPDAFARRIARNTQTVLLEESNLWRVADPAAGSGAYETLTSELCEKAWGQFQAIEKAGGMIEALRSGTLQKDIVEKRAERMKAIATGRTPLTGTSAFPILTERAPAVQNVAADPARGKVANPSGNAATLLGDLITNLKFGATRSHVTPPPAAELAVEPLAPVRLGEPFEALRDRADAASTVSGENPSVFVVNLGPLAENTGRVTWLKNLLAAGGIEGVTKSDGFTSSTEAGSVFSETGLSVVCLCGADKAYEELGEAAASLLRTAGAKRIYIAGKPADGGPTAGIDVDGHIYAGQDAIAILSELQEALGF